MKKFIKTKHSTALGAIMLFVVMLGSCSSCKNNSTNNSPPATQYGSLIFHFHTYVGNQEDTDSTLAWPSIDSINMRLYFSNIFISNIRLINAAGDTIAPLPDTVVLKHWDEETYPLGRVPAGNYRTVKFDVGLPAKINHSNPAMYPSLEPYSDLNPTWYGNKNEMWSGDTTHGYFFANIKGYVDTSTSGKGVPTQPFNIQIGGDNARTTILMPEQDFTVTPNIPWTVHMTIDFGFFLHGLNLKTQPTVCNFVTNPTLAAQMAKNITVYTDTANHDAKTMFKYEPNPQ